MHAENSMLTWVLRFVGLCGAWMAVYCCLQPISTAADLLGDVLDMIPCCGDFLESLVEGVVECVLCLISCSFGCSAALFVIAIVWIVMRPLVGIGLLVCVALLIGLAIAARQMGPKGKPSSRQKRRAADSRLSEDY